MNNTGRLLYALALFGIGCAILIVTKPGFAFRNDGTMYAFGTGHDKSVFTLGTCLAALAIVSLFAFGIIDLLRGPTPVYTRPVPAPTPTFAIRPAVAQGGASKDVFDPDTPVF
jgi:hypothetical protein